MSDDPKRAAHPLAGINEAIDNALRGAGVHDTGKSIARDCFVNALATAEASILYQRAAEASARGRNDERDDLIRRAEHIVRGVVAEME